MTKNLWCVKQGNKIVKDHIVKKSDAKSVRNELQGESPENPDDANSLKYRVSRGSDHWRENIT